ncbi:MAG: hypothetical protein P1V97_22035 [Planctomycetota bacterium]|nr:hypothetical protein [Planctomycetota bacterium]
MSANKGYIVGRVYDNLFFIYSPLIALAIGYVLSISVFSEMTFSIFGQSRNGVYLFTELFTAAHIFIVFFRSHGNQTVFRSHPYRFTIIPIVLFSAMLFSTWVFLITAVVAVWWDVYHSGMQTFGLGRIYDARAGNDPLVGRRLDMMLNTVLYLGPVLAGVSFYSHLQHFEIFSEVNSVFFTELPLDLVIGGKDEIIRTFVFIIGIPFIVLYLFAYRRLSLNGYNVSWQKVTLFAITGFCSVFTWGFNSFGQAFFIMNFFHALQYFAIVWMSEKKTMSELFRLDEAGKYRIRTLFLFLLIAFSYGMFKAALPKDAPRYLLAFALVCSIMHFWWDGFIWSVRKKQI